ncbi:hypothetical protein CALVIDRAFT_567916 [Calocera viscosa TUFC12733]|uniref:XLF-like N-terminal domain-containing protein n=1 Tax=Calocera viscosa (strain TUFC12733) TaxID=1330018 RepID=A0A167HL83_CALVF|nr:hypothetical protein CALVIDRAFT_567916 [Calocera viscosa TUFC12733]
MDFTDFHEEVLVHSAWHSITNEETSTPYLFKFSYDENEEDLSCCFLLTDTKTVWVEVMARRHLLRRSDRLGMVEEDADQAYKIRKTLSSLIKLHSFASGESLTPNFLPTNKADLLLSLSVDNFRWEWELDALPRVRGAEVLSTQLIMPMFTWSGYVMDSYMDAISTGHEIRQLERDLDASGRTAKRHVDKMVSSVIRQPLFTTALRRLTETGSGSAMRSAIFHSVDDEPATHIRTPSPPAPAEPEPRASFHRSTQRTREPTTPLKMKEESVVPKFEPSLSPPPGRASARTEASGSKQEKGEDVKEEHTGSETETEPEEDDDGPKAEQESEVGEEEYPADEAEHTARTRQNVKQENPDADEEEDVVTNIKREIHYRERRRGQRVSDGDEGEDEDYAPGDGDESPPARSTRGALRKKRVKAEASPSPVVRSPTPDRNKRRRFLAADEDQDVDMDTHILKKEESEEEKPVVRQNFVPKSRVHVKRSKY